MDIYVLIARASSSSPGDLGAIQALGHYPRLPLWSGPYSILHAPSGHSAAYYSLRNSKAIVRWMDR